MSRAVSLVVHLAPDTVNRLERAAKMRYDDALALLPTQRRLSALYLLGYSVEMCLAAAYFRAAGFDPNAPIDRDTRQSRMAQARQQRRGPDKPLMDSDSHPLVGWARLLQSQRLLASPDLTKQDSLRLTDAIKKAELVYEHWRPELRYKTIEVAPAQIAEVSKAALWFIERRGRL